MHQGFAQFLLDKIVLNWQTSQENTLDQIL